MYWMPKIYGSTIIARMIIVSPNSYIKLLPRTITSIFCSLFRQMQTYNNNCMFLTGVITFCISNKPIIDVMNKFNQLMKATSISSKVSNNRLMMLLNSFIDFLIV